MFAQFFLFGSRFWNIQLSQFQVEFLKCCLEAWSEEVNRKEPEFSMDDACEVLGVSPETIG